MFFNWLTFLIPAILLSIIGFKMFKFLFKSKKKSAETIYKLIDDLEKKYIY